LKQSITGPAPASHLSRHLYRRLKKYAFNLASNYQMPEANTLPPPYVTFASTDFGEWCKYRSRDAPRFQHCVAVKTRFKLISWLTDKVNSFLSLLFSIQAILSQANHQNKIVAASGANDTISPGLRETLFRCPGVSGPFREIPAAFPQQHPLHGAAGTSPLSRFSKQNLERADQAGTDRSSGIKYAAA
jgi:hypothetical protein